MKTPTLRCAGLLLLIIISGCTSVKRFKSASYKGEDHSLVDMALFGSDLDQPGLVPGGRNLWDLSAGAQTQLIQILNERYPDNGQFTGALNQEYLSDHTAPVTDYTHRNLRMVFTISRQKEFAVIGENGGRYSPADRIEYMKFSLEIPPEYNLHFTGWNRYTTEYGEIEIADVSFSRSIDLNTDVSTAFVDGEVKSVSGRKEEQVVKSRYMKLNGSISHQRLEMEAEGTREIDLAGNVIADVSLSFDGYPEKVAFPVYMAGTGEFPRPLALLRFADVIVPRINDAPDSIMATLEMEYLYRHVESGWKSYQEWDDRVAYYSGRVSKQISLFQRSDYLPLLYCLGTEGQRRETIKISSASGDYPLQFIDYKEANSFLKWLTSSSPVPGDPAQKLPVKVGEYNLLFGGEILTSELLSSMQSLKVIHVF